MTMFTQIEEKIKVGAIFGDGQKIKPVWFVWSGRKHQVKEVTYTWRDRQGRASLYYFSVTDGQALYELSFNDQTLVWTLKKIYVAD